jgi:hypothetical protein
MDIIGIHSENLNGDPLFAKLTNALSPEAEAAGWNAAERAQLYACIASRQPFIDFAFSRTCHDGTQQHYRVSGEPMFDQSSRFVGYRGIGVECKQMPHGNHGSL